MVVLAGDIIEYRTIKGGGAADKGGSWEYPHPSIVKVAGDTRVLEGAKVKTVKGVKKGGMWVFPNQLVAKIADASVWERVALEEAGVPAPQARDLFTRMQLSDADLYQFIGLSKSTYHRRLGKDGVIDGIPGQAVVGYADLVVFFMQQLSEFGDRLSMKKFDPGKWLGEWLREPNPSLGGVPPAELMRAPSGRVAVTRALGATFSGAYQ